MAFSAIPDILKNPDAVSSIRHLRYPEYFILFIGVAKLLGCLALGFPGFPGVREWAYAGLFFNLVGAVHSNLAVEGYTHGMLAIIPVFGLFVASYSLNRRLNPAQKND